MLYFLFLIGRFPSPHLQFCHFNTTLQSPLISNFSLLLKIQDALGICLVPKALRKNSKAVLANSSLLLRTVIHNMVISAFLHLLSEFRDDIAFPGKPVFRSLISPTLIYSDALHLGDRQLFVLE